MVHVLKITEEQFHSNKKCMEYVDCDKMEEEFSMYIGENTLAAIDLAENAEKCKYSIVNPIDTPSNKKIKQPDTNISRNASSITCGFEKREDLSSSEGNKDQFHSHHNSGQSEKLGLSLISKSLDEEETKVNTSVSKGRNASKRNLGDWGIPKKILKKYEEMGVKNMFQWQVECLSNELVLSGKNLIYSAPTSAGKTLVAELLTIKTVIERKKKAIIILPFVSVVVEKANHFQSLLEGNGIRVEGFMGGHSPIGGFQRTDVAICTIEKANSLINRLMEDGGLNKLGIVVVDELHLLGDSHRGYLLELLLTKLRYMCARDNICIQIIGMSATLPNLKLLANWLHAELYQTDFRPVPLKEFIKFDKNIYNRDLKLVSRVNLLTPIQGDSDDLSLLCLETISQGFSVLIFCPTKNWCEKLAETIARCFYSIGSAVSSFSKEEEDLVQKFITQLKKSPLSEVLERLKRSPVGLDPILARTVSYGVAFHHAGLTMDEREILEASFRSGSLRVLVATSTLSSGVNLPARRVIIRTPLFHGQLLDVLTYRQMIGRAGRMGVDTAGESILVCYEKERGMVERLLTSDLPPIQSCLGGERSSKLSGSLKRAIFEVIASGVACTPKDIESYTSFTLLTASIKEEVAHQLDLQDPTKACLKYLEENEFIRLTDDGDGNVRYAATHLGEACLAASLPPDQALALFEELQRARKCFVLEDELHIVYQVTPFSVADQWGTNLDWLRMLNIWQLLPPSMQRVGELVGVEERFMVRAMRGSLNTKAPKQMEKMAIHRRFYTALALQELSNEVPLNSVAHKYGCSRGMLQNLQQSAATFAGMVTQFCQRLRWSGLELLASQFQDRLQFGIRRELCDLMRLPMLDGQCARALFDAGIETLAVLAVDTSPEKIDEALRSYSPFQSEKNKETNTKGKEKLKNMCGGVRYLLGKNAAHTLIEEARKILQKDLGITEMKWKTHLEDEKQNISSDDKMDDDDDNQVLTKGQNNEANYKVVGSTSISSNNKIEDDLNHSIDIIANADSSITADEGCAVLNKSIPSNKYNNLKTNIKGNPSPEIHKEVINNAAHEIGIEEADLETIKVSADDKERNSITISNTCIPETPSTPNFASFTSIQSGRSSNSNRRSIDIFSSPIGNDIANNTNRSPSLFGDSFTVDTQLGSLLDGSSGSNKINLSHSSVKCQRLSLERSFKQQDDLNISTDSVPNQSTPIYKPKPMSVVSKFKLEENLSLNNPSPESTTVRYPIKRESLDICAAVGTLTPGGWDFGTVWNSEEDVYAENSIDLGANNTEPHKVDLDAKVEENAEEDTSLLNQKNLSNNDANNSSFFEKMFTATFDFGGDNSVKIDYTRNEVQNKEILNVKEENKDDAVNDFDEGEGWGSYVHNCSLEAVHHSIIGTPANYKKKKNDVIMSSDEDDDMIISSQEDNNTILLSRSKRNMISGVNFSMFSSKTEVCGVEVKDSKNRTKLGFMSSRPANSEENILDDESPVKIDDERVSKNKGSSEKVFSDTLNKSVSEVLCFNIVDVCNDINLFKVFCEELEVQKEFSFSVAASCFEKDRDNCVDLRVVSDGNATVESVHQKTPSKRKRSNSGNEIDKPNLYSEGIFLNSFIKVDGISFSFGGNDVYFISLSSCEGSQLKPSQHDKINFIKRLFESVKILKKTCIAIDLKEHFKALVTTCDVLPVWSNRFWDPKIADWLLNPTGHEKNLRNMCLAYCPELWKLLEACGGTTPAGNGWTINAGTGVTSRHLSGVESLIALKCMHKIKRQLEERNLFSLFSEIEMPTALCLVQMEALGVGFSEFQGNNMKSLLLSKMKELEKKAYALAGHTFKISSPLEVGKVLFMELRLPYKDQKNSSRSKYKKKWSTSKESLEKLTSIHRLPRVLLEWRKINSILNKTIHPLLQCPKRDRIYGRHIMHTATGRISMQEPNLQNIPRDFEILSLNSEPINSLSSLDRRINKDETIYQGEDNKLSIRHCFLPAEGFVFLSADYSQLELRIMAHLSQDKKLCSILSKGSDVFTMIASSWKNIDSTKVTSTLRQQTKKICYGILYGIGFKSLAQQLEVDDDEALNFMETFKNSFPGLKAFMISTVERCRADGYVETMGGRRRELPAINSSNPNLKAQAERQAVNTLVQGSAADLVKAATVHIMKDLQEKFPPLGYRSSYHNVKTHRCSAPCSKKPLLEGCGSKPGNAAGAILVLHLHDELIFEVAEHDLGTVIHIVKSRMEAAWKISVSLPVNLKVGGSWGTLCDY